MSKVLLAALIAIGLSAATPPAVFAGDDDDVCQDHLGGLKRIDPAQLASVVDPQRVWVTEYCVNHSVLPSEGNAAGRRAAIANNDAMSTALRRNGYSPGDVFAIKMMGADTVTLYVHR
ncbi:MAG TPA: hypothetical protein VGV07_19390 [Devosia sp.]|jgi:hypothetical protein|uniref:hypothetical protein n=1 Tax=Devosia sp. TaxID=1871048 RepID=UPI002DDD80C1|nr:hypothetical protein [Devosia sp.]HEV2517426.1 hypothetical protein [Devosia sp.]